MRLHSTLNRSLSMSLREAVLQGLAPDGGLFMPESIPVLPENFFAMLPGRSFADIAKEITRHLLHGDVPDDILDQIATDTVQFDAPLVEVESNVFALELYHGPTLAFKDFGARFLAGLLGYFARLQGTEIVILVATSGDTGSAVANGFLRVPGTTVVVLYPSGKVSALQEKQFTTLGANIVALEVEGTFDDCQRLVKQAFMDDRLKRTIMLASANSINIARLIPQTFYYFYAWAKLKHLNKPIVFSVPSGNFGNVTAGLFARKMGLPVQKFIAATNLNDIVPEYLKTGIFSPRASAATISNAMDVGNPSNFSRLVDLYHDFPAGIATDLEAYSFTDDQTRAAMKEIHSKGYVVDPHGAVGWLGVKEHRRISAKEEVSVFLETAHPGKFRETVEAAIGQSIDLPERLLVFSNSTKNTIRMKNDFAAFEKILLSSELSVR